MIESNKSGVKKNIYVSKCAQIYPHRKYNVKIPKIIMQTWKNNVIPKKWKTSPQSIEELMPDWSRVLMTDEDNRKFVQTHFPDFLPYYDAFPYNIQRADAIRYMWLYVHGGIYMDLDFEVLHPLDQLFTSDSEVYLVNSGNVGSYVTNSFMASKPRSAFWLKVIEEMKKPLPWYYRGKHVVVMNSTGPIMLSYVARKTGIVYGRLPTKYIMPCSVCNLKCSTCESFLKPLPGSSWVAADTHVYCFFLCNWKILIIAVILLLIVLLISVIIRWTGISNDKLLPW